MSAIGEHNGAASRPQSEIAAGSTRRVILVKRFGRDSGSKVILEPGATLRIGRTERAHLEVPHDPNMSGLHAELRWDGNTCRIRDLGSARGTVVDGALIEGSAELHSGGFIKLGDTVFSVYLEADTPPRSASVVDPRLAARALEALAPHMGRLFAVLDAARDPRVLELLNESVDPCQSLYEGVQGEALASVAPYLVSFRPDSDLLRRLLRETWGTGAMVFATSDRPMKFVRRHFRRFLVVEADETNARLYFRFYDPRVLREFFPLATPRQREQLLDELDAFYFEGEQGEVVSVEREAEVLELGAHETSPAESSNPFG